MAPQKILLLTPPMVQFNTPYAATPLLTAFLRKAGIDAAQADFSLELALRLFSRRSLNAMMRDLRGSRGKTPALCLFLKNSGRYLATVDGVIRFLQEGDRNMARRIRAGLLPEGPRFQMLRDLEIRGCYVPSADPELHSRLLASLYLDDLADVIRDGVDSRFGLSRYAERLATAGASFTPILRSLNGRTTIVDRLLDQITLESLRRFKPDLVGITIPFPGNVYAAFRIARRVKGWSSSVPVVVGGGFVNTEWRSLSDPRVFDYFDYVTYDDGEIPLLRIAQKVSGKISQNALVRTRFRSGRKVMMADADAPTLKHAERPAPCYEGLDLTRYCPVVETPNPMGRLWTERRWMKLCLAHGCYWHRCAFCDTRLDYIRRFDPADAETIANWIADIRRQTGESGFHFVDEAAPPALLRRLAEILIRRKMNIRWWANIRFEKSFTPELAQLLARSGCVAVTGGLECAEARLLKVMDKGIRLPQAARVMRALAGAGVLVHAYLMYGFPRQTIQEAVDGLEVVRQLFRAGCLHSAYWHRFALTVHSAMHCSSTCYGMRLSGRKLSSFTENEAAFSDGRRVEWNRLGRGLHKAVFNYGHGLGLDFPVAAWFEGRVPPSRVRRSAVSDWLRVNP